MADETVWLTQKLIGVLFEKGRSTITEHLTNIFGTGELDEEAVCRDFRHTAEDGKEYVTKFYNLDTIIAVGFRVNSARAIQFRQWATGVLRDYAIRGYVLDKERLKNGAFLSKEYYENLLAEKDYFTIHDFVKAHHHFSDPEWDGEPLPPDGPAVCPKCGCRPCECEKPPPQPCPVCGKRPCECPKQRCPVCGKVPCICNKKTKVKVKLADGKERTIQHMMATTFWHPDGTPMSAQQFMEMLFGKLPDFFKNEAELRAIWSVPYTRAKLLHGLAEKGFGHDQLAEMQKIIDAEKSDLFDVLAHVAYARPPVTRAERAANAKVHINTRFSAKQQAFLDFVLSHYVSVGVEELDQEKLTPLLRLKYHNSIADAVADLGQPEEIGKFFTGFQKYLYQQATVA